MNKKFLGIKISTYLTVICCAVAAVLFWLFVKYTETTPPKAQSAIAFLPRGIFARRIPRRRRSGRPFGRWRRLLACRSWQGL